MKKILVAAAAALAAVVVSGPVHGASSSVWTQAGAAVFYRGKLDGLTLSDEGEISLAKKSVQVLDTDEPYVWAVAVDGSGNVYAGTGNKAALYKLDGKGGSKQIAMLPGLGVTALAAGQHGEIYAGTFPEGEVSQITATGEVKNLAHLPAQYVWALKVDKDGTLLAAGGSPAGVYRIGAKGEVTNLMRSGERHILCLETDASGAIFAGSSPNGYVYKIDPATKKASVLADLAEDEAYRIVSAGGGKLLVAANRDQMPSAPQGDQGPGGPVGPPPGGPAGVPSSFPVPYNTPPPQARALPSSIYMIDMSGESRRLYLLPDPFILSLQKLDDTHFIAGTGNHGNVYTLDISKLSSVLMQLPVKQVLDIRADGKKLIYATGNPGAAYTFSDEYNATGTFKSSTNDTYSLSMWGKLWSESAAPDGTSVEFKTRTGNTSDPDETWSEWASVLSGDPAQVSSPPARYIQYMATLKTSAPGATPSIKEVNLAYVSSNQQPQINDLSVSQQPARKQPPQQQDQGSPPALQQRGPRPIGNGAGATDQQQELNYQVGTLTANGEISIKWNVTDPDGDTLRYILFFRRISDVRWAVINDEYYAAELRWQTESLPDGKYEVKLVASDAPSNPSDWARTDVKISDPFIIDNSRPAVTATVEARGRAAILKGSVTDQTSIISGIEYSVDDLKWRAAFPDDRVFDTKTETFTIDLTGLEPGGHVVVVRARDFTGNIASFSAPFTVKAR